ncbi:MAG: UPF0182 family protein [Desulfobacterales bacterium]|jgi:uncharacterized membrane protein (UPF0182 family)
MQNQEVRRKSAWRWLIAGGVLILVLALLVALSIIFVDDLVDIFWYHTLGYELYFWQRKLYKYFVFLGISLIFFLIFFINFWLASRFLKKALQEVKEVEGKAYRTIYKAFQSVSMMFYLPLSIGLSFPIALPLYRNWEHFLFEVFGVPTGILDTYYRVDASYYIFKYPIYILIEERLLIAFLILLIGLFGLYMVKNVLRSHHALHFTRSAKWHLSILVLIVFSIEIWNFMLQRYGLLFDTSHEPLFYGPGYVQMNVILPFIWGAMVLLAAMAVTLIVAIQFRKGYKLLVAWSVLLAMVLTVRYTTYLPQLIQTYIVKPNEVNKEKPYIAKNVQATLDAYKLTQVDIRDYSYRRFPLGYNVSQVKNDLRNIPVWDADTLDSVFKQLQELRTYYTFPFVNVGRYTVVNNYQQVFLSAREINYNNLPLGAKNWINEHLTYTHGFGVVMTPASQSAGDTMTWFLNDIPAVSNHGLNIKEQRIYFGLKKYPYAIAPNKAGEMDYPKGNSNVMADYTGEGGVPIGSLFKQFLLAYYFRDKNIFFMTKYKSDSKILIRRNIIDRIKYLVPFLKLDQTPYVAVTPKGIYWIVDAFTTSPWYPASQTYALNDGPINYIRNSVKIVVDAFNGTVNFYIYDKQDPIIQTYKRIYPGLFKEKEQMPADLRPHVRYPKDMFDIQMAIYAKYHQTDPQVFFQQEDIWNYAETMDAKNAVPIKPYYLTLDLIDPGQLDFLLLLPMFPKGRDNLRALAIAGCDGDNYGKIILYNFPKGELVFGPDQINALIHQDPDIAQQFTLWDQAGSSVVRGKMIILPIKKSILFIQPVYLKSTSRVKIPELQRIIMSEGQIAVMETSLEKAYIALQNRVAEQLKGLEQRYPQVTEGTNQTAPKPPPEKRKPSNASPKDHLPQPGHGQ